MKKKLLSVEALAALAAVAEGNTEEPTGDVNGNSTESGSTVPEGATAEGADDDDEPENDTKLSEATARIAELSEENTQLAGKLKDAEESATAYEAELIAEKAKTKIAEDSAKEFKTIVVGMIDGMRCSLSLAAVDMSKWSGEAVLAEYESTKEAFEKSLPVGGTVKSVNETVGKPVVKSRVEEGSFKALGF